MASIATLIDDFQDGVINSSLWNPSGTVSETGGKLVLTPIVGHSYVETDAEDYSLVLSKCTLDVATVTTAGISGSLQCGWILEVVAPGPNDSVGFRVFNNDLVPIKVQGGVTYNLAFTPYNAVTHRYWRLRTDASNLYWETSADNVAYTIRNTEGFGTLPSLSLLAGKFYAGWDAGFEFAPGTFSIESINLGHLLTASGASTSSGSATLRLQYRLTGAGVSTSSGSAAITIPPLSAHAMTASGASTSTGTASIIRKVTGQLTASAQSTSSGSASFRIGQRITASGASFATGTATISIVEVVREVTHYYTFEPPVVYDRPAIHATTPKWVASTLYYGNHSPGATGQSVLRIDGQYVIIQTPSVDQMSSATEVYQGGHIYTVDNIVAERLSAAGFTLIQITFPPTILAYPALDLYPSTTLFPYGPEPLLPSDTLLPQTGLILI